MILNNHLGSPNLFHAEYYVYYYCLVWYPAKRPVSYDHIANIFILFRLFFFLQVVMESSGAHFIRSKWRDVKIEESLLTLYAYILLSHVLGKANFTSSHIF